MSNGSAADREAQLNVVGVGKTYVSGRARTEVLRDVSFSIDRGEAVAIVGPSGAGKSTLLNIIGTLDHPSCGRVLYNNEDIFSDSGRRLAHFRNRSIGFVFQFHHLLPEFSALENVMMPAIIAGRDRRQAAETARGLLVDMGLEHRLSHRQGELSGGEQQRVAVARALVMKPDIVLADEPTGNLDSHTGDEVFGLMTKMNRELGITLIVVTHNRDCAARLSRRITLVDGAITDD